MSCLVVEATSYVFAQSWENMVAVRLVVLEVRQGCRRRLMMLPTPH